MQFINKACSLLIYLCVYAKESQHKTNKLNQNEQIAEENACKKS